MNIEELRLYCLAKPGTTEGLPFGPDVLVLKVMGKMFALIPLEDDDIKINLKCDPEMAIALREKYSSVKEGYHMNKKLWNTVTVDGSFATSELRSWIDNSYDLVVAGLPKKLREELNN